jgi:propanol-preferring alcohol dehydrogenase
MKAVLLSERLDLRRHPRFLNLRTVREPTPGEGKMPIRISACAVCLTELDEIELTGGGPFR